MEDQIILCLKQQGGKWQIPAFGASHTITLRLIVSAWAKIVLILSYLLSSSSGLDWDLFAVLY